LADEVSVYCHPSSSTSAGVRGHVLALSALRCPVQSSCAISVFVRSGGELSLDYPIP